MSGCRAPRSRRAWRAGASLCRPQHRVARLRGPAGGRHRVLGWSAGATTTALVGLPAAVAGGVDLRARARRSRRPHGRWTQPRGTPAAPILIACAPPSSRGPSAPADRAPLAVASGSRRRGEEHRGAQRARQLGGGRPPRASRRRPPGRHGRAACRRSWPGRRPGRRRPRRRSGRRLRRASCSSSRRRGTRAPARPSPRRPSGPATGRVSVLRRRSRAAAAAGERPSRRPRGSAAATARQAHGTEASAPDSLPLGGICLKNWNKDSDGVVRRRKRCRLPDQAEIRVPEARGRGNHCTGRGTARTRVGANHVLSD